MIHGLEIEGLTRSLGGRPVVNDISLSVMAGQVTCLLGPSGCGKSTTLRIIAGVDRQDAGVVRLNGDVVSDDRRHLPPEARGVGLMFQDFALFPHLTVARNIGFGLSRGTASEARIAELLDRVDLSGYEGKYPHQLSGGEQQRVALARALAPRPSVMLMDEPFSGLDNRLRDGIRDATLSVLKEEGTAVLLVTHEPDEAMRMADEIALMRDGKIVQRAAPYNIYNLPSDRQAASFFSDINSMKGEVHDGRVNTPFGEFLAPDVAEGVEVDVVFRPQHLRLDFDRGGRGPAPTSTDGTPARGEVVRARFMGKESLVEFKLASGALVMATVPAVFLPKPGTVMWLSIRRDRCFVFPRQAGV